MKESIIEADARVRTTEKAKMKHLPLKSNTDSAIIEWLLRAKAKKFLASPHLWLIAVLIIVFSYLNYAVLPSISYAYQVIFFYPLVYSAVAYRLRGVLASGIIITAILLPGTLMTNQDPQSLTNSLLFGFFAFLISGLSAILLNHLEKQWEAYNEILVLNKELNESHERLKCAQRQLIQAEKLNAIGQISAAAAHGINNPLAGVLVYAKLLSKKVSNDSAGKEEILEVLDKIWDAVSHSSQIVFGLLDFARQTEPSLSPVTIRRVIDRSISLVENQAKLHNVEVIREDASPSPLVIADFKQIQQVFVNLIINAIQAMPEGGKLKIVSSQSDGRVIVSFQDNGCGILPENLEKIFTPFFTTKEPGDGVGVGLGLAVSKSIVEMHGGQLLVQSALGEGSTFTVNLPVPNPPS